MAPLELNALQWMCTLVCHKCIETEQVGFVIAIRSVVIVLNNKCVSLAQTDRHQSALDIIEWLIFVGSSIRRRDDSIVGHLGSVENPIAILLSPGAGTLYRGRPKGVLQYQCQPHCVTDNH